jgi:hypothetical protein
MLWLSVSFDLSMVLNGEDLNVAVPSSTEQLYAMHEKLLLSPPALAWEGMVWPPAASAANACTIHIGRV